MNPEITVVMPCLNEAETLARCIEKIRQTFRAHHISGKIIVADNGSTDGSQNIALDLGAKVVHVARRGYGAALQGGIAEASAPYIIMGDADDSYDFREIPRFVEALRHGYDFVMGCRFPSGGGEIKPKAMPYIQNPWHWFTIYMGAVLGYGIYNITPKLVIKTLRWNFHGKINDLKRTQDQLRQQWGRDVVGE